MTKIADVHFNISSTANTRKNPIITAIQAKTIDHVLFNMDAGISNMLNNMTIDRLYDLFNLN